LAPSRKKQKKKKKKKKNMSLAAAIAALTDPILRDKASRAVGVIARTLEVFG
jgi:hypothetical protein